jgi:hypothetical protein
MPNRGNETSKGTVPAYVIERDEICPLCKENKRCQVYDVTFQVCYQCRIEALNKDTLRQVARWGSE